MSVLRVLGVDQRLVVTHYFSVNTTATNVVLKMQYQLGLYKGKYTVVHQLSHKYPENLNVWCES